MSLNKICWREQIWVKTGKEKRALIRILALFLNLGQLIYKSLAARSSFYLSLIGVTNCEQDSDGLSNKQFLFPYSFYCANYGGFCNPLTGGTPGVAKSIPQKVCSKPGIPAVAKSIF